MKPPIRRYMAIFAKGREMAQMSIEARSDRGAARIASGMRFKDVGYLTPVVRLECYCVLRAGCMARRVRVGCVGGAGE